MAADSWGPSSLLPSLFTSRKGLKSSPNGGETSGAWAERSGLSIDFDGSED
jgi:hypothetical protein